MVTASELREGVALRLGREVYRVLEVEAKAGVAKMGGTARARLSNVRTGRLWNQHFLPRRDWKTRSWRNANCGFFTAMAATAFFRDWTPLNSLSFLRSQ